MIWINFGRFSYRGGRWLFWKRIYWRGWRWTPFCHVEKRYKRGTEFNPTPPTA
jgi:hypothetical protein